jgi:hypothetical protein
MFLSLSGDTHRVNLRQSASQPLDLDVTWKRAGFPAWLVRYDAPVTWLKYSPWKTALPFSDTSVWQKMKPGSGVDCCAACSFTDRKKTSYSQHSLRTSAMTRRCYCMTTRLTPWTSCSLDRKPHRFENFVGPLTCSGCFRYATFNTSTLLLQNFCKSVASSSRENRPGTPLWSTALDRRAFRTLSRKPRRHRSTLSPGGQKTRQLPC